MKILHKTSLFTQKQRKKKKSGFALIATLTLMMLLAMLSVALLSLASSQQRIAMQTVLLAEARQQALVGLDVAIGELQAELGPNGRVTANSGILNERDGAGPQYILGVWDSWDGTLYGDSPTNKAPNIRSTYTKGREKMFRRWMLSSKDKDEVRRMSSVQNIASRQPGQRICMVGEGTLGRDFLPQNYVYADLLEMPSHGKNSACFAWWVGGENQKVKLTVPHRETTEDVHEILRRTWDTPAPMVLNYRDLDFLPEKIEQPDKILTLNSLPLVSSTSQSAGMPYYFDVTTYSYSLPVNVRNGGLKQDLCLLLNQKTLRGTEFAARNDSDCPIADSEDIPKGSEQKMPIGSWQNLHAYYNCWPDGTANDSNNFAARLIGGVENCHTRISGAAYPDQNPGAVEDNPDKVGGGGTGTVFEGRAMMETGSKTAGYTRTPVMLAYMCTFGLVTEQHPKKLVSTDNKRIYNLSVCFAPMFLWWNPYNVPMKVRGQQLWAQSLPYKAAVMQTYAFPQTRPVKHWNDYEWGVRGVSKADLGADYGEYFQNTQQDTTGDIVFQPGEILFFSPASARKDKNTKETNPWVLGYNPSSVAGYMAKVYYHDSPNFASTLYGSATENNIEEGRFSLEMCLGGKAKASGMETFGSNFAPNRPEAFSILFGYNGMSSRSDENDFVGKRAQSPHRGLLGWMGPLDENVNTVFCDKGRNDAIWRVDGSQSDSVVPYFIAAVGIVPKSSNPGLDVRIFDRKDYRTKMWQHSSPAFWGSMIIKPDDQQRQYHPYQLAAMDVGAGLNACPMDCYGRNGVLGINGDGEQVSFVSTMELPVHPPFSLAGFAGMRLQPGWYNPGYGGNYATQAAMRRMQYQAGVPGVGIGNSFADPCLPPGDVYVFHRNNIPAEGSNGQLFSDFYDHGLLINDAMWARWFCSSVSDMPKGDRKKEAEETLSEFLAGKEDLPVSRYKKANTPYNDRQVISRLMTGDGWKYIAQYLMIDGGFNVNSTSVEAWTSVLQGLARRKLVTSDGHQLKEVESGKGNDQVLFSRFMLSTTEKSIDSLGGYSMKQGSSQFRNMSGMLSAWGEVRMLEPESIRKLAEEMVKQVRKRGPFLNMSDFINRRLDDNGGEDALKGALQAAIDATDINKDFQDVVVKANGGGSLFKFPEAENGSMYTAAPGYLIQSDILASLGNILTVRDDTFTVRAYGCVRNPNKAILAQAWCEAVVQRTIDYVDPVNAPYESEYKADGTRGSDLSQVNRVLGRQFRVVSFKWLDIWDI